MIQEPSKKRWPLAEASRIAEMLVLQLRDSCERIIIAGSIRRKKANVGDCEILYIPKIADRQNPDSLLPEIEMVNLANEQIEAMLKNGCLQKRLNVRLNETWGEKNKLAIHTMSGIPVDLFATDLECWNVALVIRTGSRESNLRLTTGAQARGATLHAYGSGITDRYGNHIQARSEEEVFELCGQPYAQPEFRI